MATSLQLCVISATATAAATTQSALPNVALFRLQKPSSIRCSAAHNFIRANYRNRQGLGKTLHYASVAGDDDGLELEVDLDPGMSSGEEIPLEEILRTIEGDLGIGTGIDVGTDDAETEILQPQTDNTQDDE